MGRTFTHAVDAGVGRGLHGVVDHNALVAMQAHVFGQRGVGANAHGHDDQIGSYLGAVLELDCGNTATLAVVLATHQLLRLCTDQELQPAVFQRLLQHLAGHSVQLALHQRGHHVHHGHGHAAQHQAVGGFQAQKAAADDDCVFVLGSRFNHGVGVGNVAVGDHAFQVFAGHGQDEGVGAGAQQQAVVFGLGNRAIGIFGAHDAFDAVYFVHLFSRVQGDVVVAVPLPGVEHDLVQRLFTGQHGRQQDAVVVGVGLGAEHSDVVQLGCNLQQLFQRANARHAIAYHYQFGFFHCGHSWYRKPLTQGCAACQIKREKGIVQTRPCGRYTKYLHAYVVVCRTRNATLGSRARRYAHTALCKTCAI